MNKDTLFWNCRGASSDEFFGNLLNLLRKHKPNVLVLAETKTSGVWVNQIMLNSHFDSVAIAEALGFTGGL